MRIQKVAELLRSEISNILLTKVKDPKVREVVITGIEVTKDLSNARVYFTTYDKSITNSVKKGLERSAAFIRSELVRNLRIKKVPKCEFVVDSSMEYGSKIDDLLNNLNISPEEVDEESNS